MSRPPLRTLLIGLTLVPLILCIGLALFALVTFVLGPPPEDIKQIDVTLAAIRSAGGWGLLILLVCVLPGIVEEALMRGVVLSGLRRRFSAPAAVVATALLFAAMHGSPWRFMPQLALGLAAGWLAVRSGSCWPGAVTHATYNAVVVASALPAP